MENEGSSSRSVLIVEDDVAFRGLLAGILSTRGYSVLEARTAKEADQLLQENKPALVICDYRLPGTDGASWIGKFREAGYQTPVVFLTGSWCDRETFNRLRSLLRVSLILQKPIVPDLFLEQIEPLLPRVNRSQSAATTDESAGISSFSAAEPIAQEELRSLFEGSQSSHGEPGVMPTPQQPFGRDAMRRSSSRLPSFKRDESLSSKESEAKSSLPTPFETIPLSAQLPEEQAIITSEELDPLAQMVKLREKAAVEQALRAARNQYAGQLPGEITALAEKIKAIKNDLENTALREDALHIAHRLKGTAGSLGFVHVGKIAGTVESGLLNCTTDDTSVLRHKLKTLEEQVSQCFEIAQSDAERLSNEEGLPTNHFGRKVALIGAYDSFKGLSADLSKDAIAEAYLIDDIEAFCAQPRSDIFSCAMITGNGLGSLSPMEALENARATASFQTAPFCFIADDQWQLDELDESLWLYVGADIMLPETTTLLEQKKAVQELIRLNDADLPRVLTVDDDQVLTNFICSTLNANGITAQALNEPIKVLEVLHEYNPDLVLLDVVMPGVSGYDVARMLRAHEMYKHIPILFLTSKSSPEGRAAAFKAGGDDFLSKPILTEELLARVRSRLELSSVYKNRADLDKHTSLTTREVFERLLAALLARSKERSEELIVAILAIDSFQQIAIKDGFAAQESLFKDLAGLLRSRFRIEDIKCRFSEGTFALAFPRTSQSIVEKAMQCLAGEFAIGSRHNSSGRSLAHRRHLRYGISELITDGVTTESLLAAAYERCLQGAAVDVSQFIKLTGEGG